MLVSVPPVVLTVMPADGSAPFVPLAGVILTAGPAGFAGALAEEALPSAFAPDALPADLAAVVPPLVQAASVTPSAASAATPVSLLMSEPFPTSRSLEQGHFASIS